MTKALSIALLCIFSVSAIGQKTPPVKRNAGGAKTASKPVKKLPAPTPEPTPDPEADRKRFDAAVAAPSNAEKAALLRAFLDDFADSELRTEAVEYLVTSRAVVGSEKLQASDVEGSLASFRLAIEEAPTPTPDRLFDDVIAKIPASLFYQGHRAQAMELAASIEKKYAGNVKRMLGVAAFYLSVENGSEAKRVADAAIVVDPTSAASYQALGLAHRLNFDLDESAKAYSKAIELDPTSAPAKRSLAEMKRATGKPDDAAAIYRELLAVNANDAMARNGLVLSLFDGGHRTTAESELAATLERSPRNFILLAGVAYWYAANGIADKAVEYAQKAVDFEPRYIWGHIALGRGLMKQNRPIDAERILIKARQYGNFPTLEYEIASARFKAGLYREAVEELQKSFSLRDGMIETLLGGRVAKSEKSFQELLSYERRASILEPAAADDADTTTKLRILFEMTKKIGDSPDVSEMIALADEFVKGDDKMKLHRQLHAADLLLQKNIAVSKAAELVKAAVGNADAGLDVSAAGAAVMASELYESRTVAFARNEIVLIPEVPRQMLSAILRGRIEELAGWSFYQQKDYPAAIVRLKRAVSVMPDKSAWWRASMWRLGSALEANGNDKEALETYIQSYKIDRPSGIRYGIIESLYQKVNGKRDGLEEIIGPNPMPTVALAKPQETVEAKKEPELTTGSDAPKVAQEPPVNSGEKKAADIPESKNVEPAKAALPEPGSVTKAVSEPTIKDKEDQPTPPEQIAEVEKPRDEKQPVQEVTKATEPEKKSDEVKITAKDSEQKAKNEPELLPEKLSQETKNPSSKDAAADNTPETAAAKNSPQPEVVVPPAPSQQKEKEPATDIQADGKKEPVVEKAEETKAPEPKDVKPPVNDIDPVASPPAKTDEAKPPGDAPANLLRDPFAQTVNETKPAAVEKKPVIVIDDPLKADDKASRPKDLFEPVIISVPRNSSPKGAPNSDPAKPTKGADEAIAAGTTRRRVIEGKEIKSDQQCSIDVSQENISLLNGGGSLGILVSIAGDGQTKDVTATSTSPDDIEVRAEPEISGISGRRFYVIKSVSANTGVYQLNFESPCGKKEISVRVR